MLVGAALDLRSVPQKTPASKAIPFLHTLTVHRVWWIYVQKLFGVSPYGRTLSSFCRLCLLCYEWPFSVVVSVPMLVSIASVQGIFSSLSSALVFSAVCLLVGVLDGAGLSTSRTFGTLLLTV